MIGRHSLLFLLSLLSMACDLSAAFVATTSKRCSTMNFQAARLMPGAMAHHNFKRGLSMSEEGEQEKAPSPKSGTYYDDEVDPIPASKVGISETMKERLKREATVGLDSEKKQTNILLYIMATVAVLVLLGGQGILY